MKNIAIPLLVAGSANAQLGDMSKDRAVKAPTLIATTLLQDGCTDDDVADAQAALVLQDTAVATAMGAIALTPDGGKSPQTIFDEALAARVAASTAVAAAQADAAAAFATDDAARLAVAAARLALGTATDVRALAVDADAATQKVKDDAIAALGAASTGTVLGGDFVQATGANLIKETLDAAKLAATAHLVHERQELAQLECTGNYKIDQHADQPVGSRVAARCTTSEADQTACKPFRASQADCQTLDAGASGASNMKRVDGRSGGGNDQCQWTAAVGDATTAYLEPTYATDAASEYNCSAPKVDGIARTTDGLSDVAGKPAIGLVTVAGGLKAIALAKAAVLTATSAAPDAANDSMQADYKIAAAITLEEKHAEMTERAFSAGRAFGQAAARYRQAWYARNQVIALDTATGLKIAENTADQVGILSKQANDKVPANPGGVLSQNVGRQAQVTDFAMAGLVTASTDAYKDNTSGSPAQTRSYADLGAWIALARTLSAATAEYWAIYPTASETFTGITIIGTASGANACVNDQGGVASDCTDANADKATCIDKDDSGTSRKCIWKKTATAGTDTGPCDTSSGFTKSIGDSGTASTIALCQAECEKLLPWNLQQDGADARVNLPVTAAFAEADGGATYCFGFSFQAQGAATTDYCQLATTKVPTAGTANYNGDTTSECKKRDLTTKAAAYHAAYLAAMVTTAATGVGGAVETPIAYAQRMIGLQSADAEAAAKAFNNLRITNIISNSLADQAIPYTGNTCAGGDACTAVQTAGGADMLTDTACVAAKKTDTFTACDWARDNGVFGSSAIAAPWGLETLTALTAAADVWKGATVRDAVLATIGADLSSLTVDASTMKTWTEAIAAAVRHKTTFTDAQTASAEADAALKANRDEITSTWVEIAAQTKIVEYAGAQVDRAATSFQALTAASTAVVTPTAADLTDLTAALTEAERLAKVSTLALTGTDAIALGSEQTPAAASVLFLLNGLRGTFDAAVTALGLAKDELVRLDGLTKAAVLKQTGLAATLAEKIQACEVAKFKTYSTELQTAVQKRVDDLAAIRTMLDGIAVPARGAAGARCEKAFSNGTFRPARTNASGAEDKTYMLTGGCGENLCCGAAVVVPDSASQAVMTIETCQPTEGTVNYNYQPARPALAAAMPATQPVPWTCISGAKKLVSAASALAAAVYVLA